ncbi:MAG TPA: PaaI family thioesterase [Elusimicrobiales bacterium]|nr:PaaI family thioesterase [Elusimicrobiales bacterium]
MSLIDDGKKADKNTFDTTRKVHDTCVVCGDNNPAGLKIKFVTKEDESVTAEFYCPVSMEGYKGYLQGGITACLIDSAMANCLFARGVLGFTAELNIKYKSPVKCGQSVTVNAKINKAYPPLYLISAEILQNGNIVVTADAKFMESEALNENK